MGVAEAAPPAASDHRGLADGDEIRDQGARVVVEDGRPGRNVEGELVARRAVPPRPFAATARGGLEVVLVTEIAKRRLTGVDSDVDRPASAAVAAIGSAARDMRFLTERRRAVAARSGLDEDLDAVEEHRGHCRIGPRFTRESVAERSQ